MTKWIQNEGFQLSALSSVKHLTLGTDRSIQGGGSGEYQFSRDWHPGDSIRHLDWRSWAATGRLATRCYDSEREMTAIIAVDQSPSMALPPRAPGLFGKYEMALRIAGGLIHACLTTGRRLTIFGSQTPSISRPSAAKREIFSQAKVLTTKGVHEQCLLARNLDLALSASARRSLVFVITDLTRSADVQCIDRWKGMHDFVVLVMADLTRPCVRGAGFLSATEAESSTGGMVKASTVIHTFDHMKQLRLGGVQICQVLTTQKPTDQVRAWLLGRKGGAR